MTKTNEQLVAENADLLARLEDAQAALEAIRSGQVDALFLASGPTTKKVYTLEGADHPYRVFVEVMQQGAVTLGDDSTVLFCNRRFAAMMRLPAERLLGTPFKNFVRDADRPGFATMLQEVEAGTAHGEVGLVTGDGGVLPVYLHLSVLPLTGGTAYCVVVTDLTERKEHEALAEAKRLLADSEARLRVTLASIGDAVIVTDGQGRVTFMNAVAENLTGWTRQDASGEDLTLVFNIVNEQTGQTVESPVTKAIREGTVVGLANHTVLIAKDGTRRPIDDSGAPIRDALNEFVGVVLVFRDVAERRQAELALQRSEQTARFLAQASAELAELTDPESTLQKLASAAVPQFADWCAVDFFDADAAFRRLTLRHADPARAEVVQELRERYPPRLTDPHGVANVFRTGAAELVEDISDTLLAALAYDEAHLGILRGLGLRSYLCVPMQSKGTTLGVLTFVTAESGRRYDATDLRAAEDLARRAAVAIENTNLYRTLRETDRRKDEFLATLAHELRNPLAPIRNALQIIRQSDERQAREQAPDMMERQVGQMVRLVDDLLDVSRITKGKLQLRKELVELADVVYAAAETARPVIEVSAHELTVTLPPQPIVLQADPTRLAQVVANLLNNAAKYTEKAGHIWLTAERRGNEAVVSVRDTGIGITSEQLPHIFQMFSQVASALERSQGGLGIGLSLVKGLVELHGGTIEAHSSGPGKGSEFTVHLPIVDLPVKAPSPNDDDKKAPSVQKYRILVVDDLRDAADSMAMMLRMMGHQTRTAYDGLEAVQTAAAFRPNVVLLDIGLPKMNGYEAARRIRNEPWGGNVALVALTGWGQEEDKRRSLEAGFDHHLTKPVDPAALAKLLALLMPQN